MLTPQFLRFIATGILNTAFSYGIYATFIYWGFTYAVASLISLILGILFSFKTQGALVFKNTDNRLLLVFTLNWLLIYLFMVGFIYTMVRLGFNEYWAGILAMPPLAIFSYITQKFLVFRKQPKTGIGRSLPLGFYVKNYRHFIRRIYIRNGYGVIEYGSHSYGVPFVRWWGEEANLTIGKFCSIAGNVEIFLGGNHRTDWLSTYPFPFFRKWKKEMPISEYTVTRGDVVIGNDVWIGSGAILLSGITVGNGAVIGSHAIVTRSVPDYGIVAGNPARLVRLRFTDEQVQHLNKLAWWNWDMKEIRSRLGEIMSNDIDGFIQKYAGRGLRD